MFCLDRFEHFPIGWQPLQKHGSYCSSQRGKYKHDYSGIGIIRESGIHR